MYTLFLTPPQHAIVWEAITLFRNFNRGMFDGILDVEFVQNRIKNERHSYVLQLYIQELSNLVGVNHVYPEIVNKLDGVREALRGSFRGKFLIGVDQANTIVAALDFLSRLNLGQFHVITDTPYIWDHGNLANNRYMIEGVAAGIKHTFDLLPNASYGIGHPDVPAARKAYDILCVIRHRLAWDKAGNPPTRDWSTMFGVNYDLPLHTYKSWPLAKMEQVSEEEIQNDIP